MKSNLPSITLHFTTDTAGNSLEYARIRSGMRFYSVMLYRLTPVQLQSARAALRQG